MIHRFPGIRLSSPCGYASGLEVTTTQNSKLLVSSYALLMTFLLVACSQPLFPAAAVRDLDPALQMGIFNPEADIYFKGHLAQAGGRVIATERTPDGTMITAEELPLTKASTRVVENAKSQGWFVFLYNGQIDPDALRYGNKFIMVGIVEGNQRVTINSIQRPAPYLVARCLHVWKTGRYAIADYPYLPDGYYPLAEQTYCLPSIK